MNSNDSSDTRYGAGRTDRRRTRGRLASLVMLAAATAAGAIWPELAPVAPTDAVAGGSQEVVLAYVDPGSAGFLITVVLGFLAAFGYTARSWLRRVRRLILRGTRSDGGASNDGAPPRI